MEYDRFATLKRAVREIRAGMPIAGYTLTGDIIESADGKRYRVSGKQRLHIVELEVKKIVREVAVKVPRPEPRSDCTCTACGATFSRSKFNPYIDKCPSCRACRPDPAESRKFTCLKCGQDFLVSKYHPYRVNPEKCPRCTRNEGIRRRAKARRQRLAARAGQ